MKCKFCDTELIYIETAAGSKMPCEEKKIKVWRAKKGKVKVCTDRGDVFSAETEPVPFVGEEYAYPVHFGNCPGTSQARRRK